MTVIRSRKKGNTCYYLYHLQNVAGAIVPLDTPAVAAARADHLRTAGAALRLH